jgi:superfamily II DNA or RNA helicase
VGDLPKVEERKLPYKVDEKFEVLNEDSSILVLVDEAHRTQAGDLHANLLAGLPNCARIGFTGTPIIMGDKKRTHEIFGEFIDRYTIKEAEADGATVPVLYEGRTANGAIRDGASLDELFEDLFRQHTPEELEAIKKKYATKGHIFDAPALIADKAPGSGALSFQFRPHHTVPKTEAGNRRTSQAGGTKEGPPHPEGAVLLGGKRQGCSGRVSTCSRNWR